MNTRISRSGQAFDAAGASGLAFLTSSLALIDPVVTRPLQSQTYERDIDIRYGGGLGAEFMNAWASNYATSGGNALGLQGTSNTDIPLVNVDLQMGTWKSFVWAQGFVITYMDLQRLEFANSRGEQPPISFQELYNDAIDSVFNKAMDRVTYLGWLGQPGLVNNSAITATTVAATGTGSATFWSTKTPVMILADVNALIQAAITASVYDLGRGMPNRMLIPWSVWSYLSQPMTTAGSESTINYIERSNIATTAGTPFKMLPIPDPWVATAGSGSTKRSIVYRKDPANIDLFVPQIPTNVMTTPTTRNGVGWETVFMANIGQLRVKIPQSAIYGDGV
jgi:hypothetical protein